MIVVTIFIISSRSESTKALIFIALAKEALGRSLRINKICNILTMKSAAELNRLLLKFVLLCQVDSQGNFLEGNAKFNFLGTIWKSDRSWRVHLSDFRRA